MAQEQRFPAEEPSEHVQDLTAHDLQVRVLFLLQ